LIFLKIQNERAIFLIEGFDGHIKSIPMRVNPHPKNDQAWSKMTLSKSGSSRSESLEQNAVKHHSKMAGIQSYTEAVNKKGPIMEMEP
jgi:hypothetical protein